MTPASSKLQTPPRRGCRPTLGCLVRGPLGCLSFLAGAAIVVVLLLPTSVGRFTGPSWEESFARGHQGTLQFGEFRLLWASRQRIENILLHDPEGRYVGSADVHLPPMIDCLGDYVDQHLRMDLKLDLNLVRDESGGLNLARAFERSPEAAPDHVHGGWVPPDRFRAVVNVVNWHLAWSTPRMRSETQNLALILDEGRLDLSAGGGHGFEGSGQARWSFPGPDGRVEGQGDLTIDVDFDELEALLTGQAQNLTYTWSVDGLHAAMLELIGPAGLPYAEALGTRVASVEVRRPDAESEYRVVRLRGASQRLTLAGAWEGDVFVDDVTWQGGRDAEPTHVDFKLGDYWTDVVLAGLLPFLGDLQPAQDGAVGRIELADYRVPREGNLEALEGRLTVDLAEIQARFLPHRAGDPDWSGTPAGVLRLAPIRLRIEGGRVSYESLEMTLGEHSVEVGGHYDLLADELDLVLRLPPDLARELGVGEPGPDEGSAYRLRLTGSAAEPVFD